MRYLFRSVLWVILFSICIFGQHEAVGEKKDFKSHLKHFEYIGLLHPLEFSPNGRYQVVISENRYHGGSDFALMLAVMRNEGRDHHARYSLTPQYLEVVAAPDGNISYVRFDPSSDYAVDLILMKEGRLRTSIAVADSPIEQLQFSEDGQHFCYFMPFEPHPFQPPEIKHEQYFSRMFNPAGWMIYEMGRSSLLSDKTGGFIFSDEEKKAFTKWAPIEEPKVIPQLYTQPMPKITLETKVHWAPDSKYIYVYDGTGIWRVPPYPNFCPMWTKIVHAPRISNLQISSTGKHLLYEMRPDVLTRSDEENRKDPFDLHNEIWLVDIEAIIEPIRLSKEEAVAAKGDVWELDITKELKPHQIAKGWRAAFNPSGKTINYANTEGFFLLDFETMESNSMFLSGSTIHYNKSLLEILD